MPVELGGAQFHRTFPPTRPDIIIIIIKIIIKTTIVFSDKECYNYIIIIYTEYFLVTAECCLQVAIILFV